jgi:hypothetical protein
MLPDLAAPKVAVPRIAARGVRTVVASAAPAAATVHRSVAATGVRIAKAVPSVVRPGGHVRHVRKGGARIGRMLRVGIARVQTVTAVRVHSRGRVARGVRIRRAQSVPMASAASGSRALRVTTAAVKVAAPVPKAGVPRVQEIAVVPHAATRGRVVTSSAARAVRVARSRASVAVARAVVRSVLPVRHVKAASASLRAAADFVDAKVVHVRPGATQSSYSASN